MPASPSSTRAAFIVIAAGVAAALHVAKLPPAIGALQKELGLSLVDAGFLLSTVQLAGMTTAVAMGAWVDTLGLRRSVIVGLCVLAAASFAGAAATTAPVLLVLRAAEGFGFLMVVLPAPGLVRALVPPTRINKMMGMWGAYMPLGTAAALLAGAPWVEVLRWPSWWCFIGAVSAAMAIAVAAAVPPSAPAQAATRAEGLVARLARTLSRRGPWLLALSFAVYSSQWLAVVGFLPAIYEQAGISAGARGALTALAAAVNMAGNIGAGRLLHRGWKPVTLIRIGYTAMAAGAVLAFSGPADAPVLRYLAVLAFSLVGGLVPATLFSLSIRLAPDERTLSTTVGWMQQWSAFGQFVGPPVVAAIASRTGGWEWTWVATGAASLLGLGLSFHLGRLVSSTMGR